MKKLLLLPTLFLVLSLSFSQNTLTVNLPTDKGVEGELRFAINKSKPGDIISINEKVENIVLEQGEIEILHDLHILGTGKTPTIISGNDKSRIFNFPFPKEQFPEPVVLDPTKGEKIYGSLVENIAFTNGSVGDKDQGINEDGGAILLDNRHAVFRHATFRNNTANGHGGAIFATNGLLSFEYCSFETNTSTNEGVGNGGALVYACEQAQSFLSPSLEINYSSFTKNTCANGAGGAIYLENYSTNVSLAFEIKNSTFSNNSALQGGALANDVNEKTYGTITQCTFSGNNSTYDGGAINILSRGSLDITSSTITENKSLEGNGGGISNSSAFINLFNNIISNNQISTSSQNQESIDLMMYGSAYESMGYNFLGEKSAMSLGNSNNPDIFSNTPSLAPLANNGGPTLTHLPLDGSPVIDAGGFLGNDIKYDQRGAPFIRVSSNGKIDIGAVESSDASCPRSVAFDAGPNLQICADSVVFKPTQLPPTGWTSTWSMGASNTTITPLSANEIQVGSSLNPIQEDFQTPTTVYLTIDSASCRFSDSFVIKRDYDDQIPLELYNIPLFCTDTSDYLYHPSLSSYDSLRWSVIRGTATLINPTREYSTQVTGMSADSDATLQLKVYNGVCPVKSDTIVLSYIKPITPTVTIKNISASSCVGSTVTLTVTHNIPASFYPDINWINENNANWNSNSDTVNIDDYFGDTISAFVSSKDYCVLLATDTAKMSVNQTPRANAGDFNVETTEICQGDSTIFEVANSVGDFHKWYRSVDGGTTLTPLTVGVIQDTIIKRTTPKNSFDEITYYHETGNACDTAMSSITFYLDENPVAGTLITPSNSICEGASTYLKLNNTNADYYEWEYFDGTSWSYNDGLLLDSVNILISDTIIYRVLAYFYESTCSTPDTSNSVTINSTPSSEAATLVTANTEICASDSITLQYTGGIGAAKWFVSENGAPYLQTVFPSMVGDSIANNVVFTNSGNTPIVYDVYVQTSSACDSAYSDTITIKVNPKPIITSLTDTASCDQYLLPTITGVGLSGNEAYYTQPNGNGIQYLANDLITNTTTLYLYDESGTTPNCSDEKPVTITIDSTNSINAGPDQTICANNPNVVLNGNSSNGGGTVWSSNGTGIFMPNATSPNTQYVPSNTDIQTGTITLSLTATATGACPNTSDDLILNITPAPVVDAGADIALCSDNSTINLNGLITQATGGIWSGGTGVFTPNANTLATNYTPSPAEILTGTVTLTLTSTGNGICLPEQDMVNIKITPAITIDALTDQIVCDSFQLPTITGTNITGNEAYYLLPNGGGTAYTAGDFINTSSTIHIFDQTSSIPSCTAESSFELTINSTPSIDDFVNVVECASYTLPTISGNLTGNEAYYDAENGLGNSYQAGEVITESITLYVFAQTATTPNCTSEISFDISISSPTLSLIDDTISVIAGSPIAIPVTENDTIDGIISLIRVLNENPVTETATIQGNTVVYTSSNGFKGGVTIDYEITDECNTDTASIYITVENTNPIAKDTTLELGSQTTLSLDLNSLITDEDNNVLINALSILTTPQSGAIATLTGSILAIDYSSISTTNNSDFITIAVIDAGGDSDTINIEILIKKFVVEAGDNQSIKTYSTTLEATPTPGFISYWSTVEGITFNNSTNPTTLASGFKPEKSPYILIWNVEDGNELYTDTVIISVENIAPSVFIIAKEFIIEKDIATISLDSLVSDPNQNLASIQIITPFLRLEPRVVQINNENLTISIDLTKSDINFATGLVDSLEYEICDELNACDRGYIKVLRKGIINLEAFVSVEEIKPSIVYNFLSPNNDQLNGNFFFDIIMKKSDSSEVPITIVTDNNTSGLYRNDISFEDFFKNHVERIQVVIFNRWGDVVDSYEDYFGGQAFINGKITGDEIGDNYVWKGKDKNGNNLTPGTYYFYIKLFNKNIEDFSDNGFIELRN